MNIVFLYLNYESDIFNHQDYFNSHPNLHALHKLIKQRPDSDISVIQRATFKSTPVVDGVQYFFTVDEYSARLRWWQEPRSSIAIIKNLKPNIAHVPDLNLPLQFRWLRRQVGNDVAIIGEHTGETIWANRKIWLQQFGLRVVDGFIFTSESDKNLWIKTSVILPRQTIYLIPQLKSDIQKTVQSLLTIYLTVDNQKKLSNAGSSA